MEYRGEGRLKFAVGMYDALHRPLASRVERGVPTCRQAMRVNCVRLIGMMSNRACATPAWFFRMDARLGSVKQSESEVCGSVVTAQPWDLGGCGCGCGCGGVQRMEMEVREIGRAHV